MYQGRGNPIGHRKKLKKSEKPIDKPQDLWYNKDKEREGKPYKPERN